MGLAKPFFLFSNHEKICLHFIATIFRYEPYQREPKQHLQYGLYHAMYSTNFHFKGMTPWSRPFSVQKFGTLRKHSAKRELFVVATSGFCADSSEEK